MRKIVLYIAMSLDGYIADKSGGVSWLGGDGSEPENYGSYPEFIDTVDTVILGYKTYHQIVTELSPDRWPYEGMQSYVMTHREEKDQDEVHFINVTLIDLLTKLKQEDGKAIWLCGGADIVDQALRAGIVDGFDLVFHQSYVIVITRKNNIATIQIGFDFGKIKGFKSTFQFCHWNLIFTADINATQKCKIAFHIQKCLHTISSNTLLYPVIEEIHLLLSMEPMLSIFHNGKSCFDLV